jgi:hypothetical protein
MTVLVMGSFLLSGCIVQSKVQGRYIEDQGGCRDEAETNIGRFEKPNMTTKDRNAQLVTLFSNCMAKKGWQVARPKRTTTAGPSGPLDPYGRSATTTTTTAGPAGQPGQQGLTQQQYQEQQQQLLKQQQDLARQQQQLREQQQQLEREGQSSSDAMNNLIRQQQEIQRQQQELLRQQFQLQQQMEQQQRVYQNIQGTRPVQTTTTPLSPSGGMPPLSQPTGGYYQPGRSYTAPTQQPFGSGAGRSF